MLSDFSFCLALFSPDAFTMQSFRYILRTYDTAHAGPLASPLQEPWPCTLPPEPVHYAKEAVDLAKVREAITEVIDMEKRGDGTRFTETLIRLS
jgi:hypothetical protein